MTKTDWRSEFNEKFEIGTIKYFKPLPHFTMYTRDLEIKKFIEQTRIEAQIEVLEKVLIREFYKDGSVFEEVNEDRVENEIIRLKTLKQK